MIRFYRKENEKHESAFYIESSRDLDEEDMNRLRWLLADKHKPQLLRSRPHFSRKRPDVKEFGPLLHVVTPKSSNAVSICHSCGISGITRVEQFSRLVVPNEIDANQFIEQSHDKMTEAYYPRTLRNLTSTRKPEATAIIPVMEQGRIALAKANKEYGTGMDEVDLNYYLHLFTNIIMRNPTETEWRDLGNSNSEHSRHHAFGAKLIIDGEEMPFTLMALIKSTLTNPANSIIAFHDNASAIRCYPVKVLVPALPGMPSPMRMVELLYHFVLTCETHNHPCLWQAYQGAATGRGGRERDSQAVGRGAIGIAGSVGFFGGNLNIPGYALSWENQKWPYDSRVESGLSFLINATNGAFDDGNQFGEPTILGFAKSFGLTVADERIENIKPIMFSGGFGVIDNCHTEKHAPQRGWLVVKIGGLAYAVGVGGGSASSMMQGESTADLDFNSVQRADGEMAQKTDRVLRACLFMGDKNPIESIHDQGAGGNGNVLKEIVHPAGAKIYLRNIPLGDQTMSQTQIWIAEYQENLAILVKPENWETIKSICDREKCPCAVVGTITSDGKFVVVDEKDNTVPVDLELKYVFGDYPQKTIHDVRQTRKLTPLNLPSDLTVNQALRRIFKLLDVASKEWLVSKVDHSVTGKVVQAQSVGPLGLPLSNYSVIAPSPWSSTGEANSVALRPSIGLISPQAMARMTAATALLKLIGVPVSRREDVKASANWMLAAKWPGAMAWVYDAALAYKEFAAKIDLDGGKDSMSLAAEVPTVDGDRELIRSLNTLVISTYAACPDYRLRTTPDLKRPDESRMAYLDLANGKMRLGGSALAHVFGQIGNQCPDVEDVQLLIKAFACFQELIRRKLLLAIHKRSRGGLLTTLCEMAFAGNCGLDLNFVYFQNVGLLTPLFNEELGLVFEYLPENWSEIQTTLFAYGIGGSTYPIGVTTKRPTLRLKVEENFIPLDHMKVLREGWRETAYQLEEFQTSQSCIASLRASNPNRIKPPYNLTFDPDEYPAINPDKQRLLHVAIIREEGSNSDEEMKNAFFLAGFKPWDITITDIVESRISLNQFVGVAFVGGFSFKDVFGAAKGWAGVMKFNQTVAAEFKRFFSRPDTFSLGICNGCQLMAFGIVPWELPEAKQLAFVQNSSGRFEARFPSVRIDESPAIMLQGMTGSILGVHCAHGEGRFICPDLEVLGRILKQNLAPICFVDDDGLQAKTNNYPTNPNGSLLGKTALCTPDGRHLAFMEHPERTVLKQQWQYWPSDWDKIESSPWLRMFQNARLWCERNN